MSSSVLWRFAVALIAGGSWLVLRADYAPYPPIPTSAIIGGILVLAGLILVIVVFRDSFRREYQAALHSPDAIARWRVDQANLKAFRAIDAARNGRIWSLKNFLKLPRVVPPDGLPIVVGEHSLIAGRKWVREFTAFGTTLVDVTWHEGDPGFIELHSEIMMSNGTAITVMRIPVPTAARSEAAKAFSHLKAQIDPHYCDEIHWKFGAHFEAATQPTDAPHRLQSLNRYVLVAVIAFFLAAFGAIGLASYFSQPPARQETRVVACESKETERINDFLGADLSEGNPDAASVRASLTPLCAQFFDRILAAADAGTMIPYLSGDPMHDPTTGTTEVPGVLRCDRNSCTSLSY
jgi:hypothetical protein